MPNNSFKPTPCRGVGHVLCATLARVRRPVTGRLNSGVRCHMTIPASESEVREALVALRAFLSKLAAGSTDSITAERSLRLLSRYEHIAMNESYCLSLGSDLTRGISEWAWRDDSWAALEPLIDDLLNKAVKLIDLAQVAPNNSFKPNPHQGGA